MAAHSEEITISLEQDQNGKNYTPNKRERSGNQSIQAVFNSESGILSVDCSPVNELIVTVYFEEECITSVIGYPIFIELPDSPGQYVIKVSCQGEDYVGYLYK